MFCGGFHQSPGYLSLSRLNHRLPGYETYPEVVQGAAEFHAQITDALLPQAEPVFDDTTTLPTAVDRLDAPPAVVQGLVGQCLLQRQRIASWVLRRHAELHLGERAGQKAQILQQPTSRRQGIGSGVSAALIRHAAARGLAEAAERQRSVDQQDRFARVVLFLAALTVGRFSRVLGADDAPFRPVMGQRGEPGGATGAEATGARSSASGVIARAASASATPRRGARVVRERGGAAPRVRHAASNAGKSTWLHGFAFLCRMPNRRPCTTWRVEGLRDVRRKNSRASGGARGQC